MYRVQSASGGRSRDAADSVNVRGRWLRLASDGADLIRRFYDGIEKYNPTLVSPGTAPVSICRCCITVRSGTVSTRHVIGNRRQRPELRWNIYLSRFQSVTDLVDVLSRPTSHAPPRPLDDIALLLGLPGKMGHQGVGVQNNQPELEDIRNYCETDVLNTYLVYLRYELCAGIWTPPGLSAKKRWCATCSNPPINRI